MKRLLLLSTILISIASCSVSKKPEFRHIENIEVKNVSMRNVTINADAIFNNPNHLKGKLSIDSIRVFVDNIDIGMISSQEFDVPPKGEFTIPLKGSFSLSKIYNKNKNMILGNILKIVQTDSLLIKYKGSIRYHLGAFSYPYTVNKEQRVSIK